MSSIAQEDFIKPRHQLVAHVFAQFGNELEVLGEERLKQRLRQIAFVADEFAPQAFGQLAHRDAVIGVARGETLLEQLPFIVDDEMELEAIEPALLFWLRPACSAKTRCVGMRRLWHTASGVESMKAMPVQRPKRVRR